MVYSKSNNTNVFDDDSQCIREMDNSYDTWDGWKKLRMFCYYKDMYRVL